MTTTSTGPGDGTRAVLLGKVPPWFTAALLGPWTARARCAGMDSRIFFPAHDDPATEARQACARCPVRGHCLSYALENDERYGIWGGLDPAERANLRRRLRQHKTAGT